MSTSQQLAVQPAQPHPYRQTAADNIRKLSTVNQKNIPTILRTSATAISQLTNNPIVPTTTSQTAYQDSPQSREVAFARASEQLFTLINITRDALHSQISKLKDENVIPAETVRTLPSQGPTDHGQEGQQVGEEIKNGGLGDLDVGVLNARARVGREGEEVLDRVTDILQDLVKKVEGEDRLMVDG
ncbi:hypothetical protein CC78DRAFT_567097 [Lojkania enalia]|uniref:Mediator of RNA polymerase II transcription subunit 11 n=1 Tax=Lojkania enalia TaxID=147567 RepID=A0A9P4KBJ8_9PLEO|nr:hypothetical protein CC78DRAFT_567097 [Didymosphaeria enalia]